MQIRLSPKKHRSGQFLVEGCIAVALMTFSWIIISYSLFMANNHIRTEMAGRYAAWYQGANGNGTPATAAQLNQYFFYQPLSSIKAEEPNVPLSGIIPGGIDSKIRNVFLGDDSGANGPFKVSVSFGVTTVDEKSPFPFSLLKTKVPLMPDSMMLTSVTSTNQWDGTADTWSDTPGKVNGLATLGFLGNLIKGIF